MPFDMEMIPYTFIQGAVIHPVQDKCLGDSMNEAVLGWAFVRGHKKVISNTRVGYKKQALEERYGFRHVCNVVSRDVPSAEYFLSRQKEA